MDIRIYKVTNIQKLVSYLKKNKNIDIYTGFELANKVNYPLLYGYDSYGIVFTAPSEHADILEECCKFKILGKWLVPIKHFNQQNHIIKMFKGKPVKLAKCGNHSLADCQKRFDKYVECKTCTLVNHHFVPIYIYINGIKYKRCPHCKQYYKIDMFAKNNGKHKRLCSSWCKKCINQYNINAYENNQWVDIL